MIAPPAEPTWIDRVRQFWRAGRPTLPCPECGDLHDVSLCPVVWARKAAPGRASSGASWPLGRVRIVYGPLMHGHRTKPPRPYFMAALRRLRR